MGTSIAPTWPIMSLVSGGGSPLYLAASRANSLKRTVVNVETLGRKANSPIPKWLCKDGRKHSESDSNER